MNRHLGVPEIFLDPTSTSPRLINDTLLRTWGTKSLWGALVGYLWYKPQLDKNFAVLQEIIMEPTPNIEVDIWDPAVVYVAMNFTGDIYRVPLSLPISKLKCDTLLLVAGVKSHPGIYASQSPGQYLCLKSQKGKNIWYGGGGFQKYFCMPRFRYQALNIYLQ